MKKQRRGLDRYNVLHDGWKAVVLVLFLLSVFGVGVSCRNLYFLLFISIIIFHSDKN